MPLLPGDKLGPYEIQTPLGAGGMGEVFQARDTRLNRTVAIKTSKAQFSERFEREARAVAALNHPNICTLHDVGALPDGTGYLVFEHVEGEQLLTKAKPGPLTLERALDYASQICAALDAAHSKHITHRDLKPANILVTKQGVKLLDFGLARFNKDTSGPVLGLDDATRTMAITGEGAIVGTLHYMSPEQINGREADARSDIFSFGLVLYEMLTGRKAFPGDTAASVMAAILERPAPSITDVAPAALDRVLKKCLAKDPEDRWQSARDLRTALELAAASSPKLTEGAPPSKSSSGFRVAAGLAIVFALAAAVLAFRQFREPPPELPLISFDIPAPGKVPAEKFALSPDGKNIAFFAPDQVGGFSHIWIRSLGSTTSRKVVEGTTLNPPELFWSRDGRSIYFNTGNGLRTLSKADVRGGSPQVMGTFSSIPVGGSENQSGTLLIGMAGGQGILQLPTAGGSATAVTTIDRDRSETNHRAPIFLPNGKRFLYLINSNREENEGIYVGSLDTPPDKQSRKRLVATRNGAVLASVSGETYLLYMRGATLVAQPFDAERAELHGEPKLLTDRVAAFANYGYFGAANQILVYRTSTQESGINGGDDTQITIYSETGSEGPLAGLDPGGYNSLAFSPDGGRLAIARRSPQIVAGVSPEREAARQIWIMDLSRRVLAQLTFGEGGKEKPVWSPDGKYVAFAKGFRGTGGIFRKASDGTGAEETLLPPAAGQIAPDSWSPDGTTLLYTVLRAADSAELYTLPTGSGAQRQPQLYLKPAANGQFSPDGRWVAYVSSETGSPEVYVQSFPAGNGKWLISNGGGAMPRWSHDGKHLYYIDQSNAMSVDISKTPTFQPGASKRMFGGPFRISSTNRSYWDVYPSGNRFLIQTWAETQDAPYTVIFNWSKLLR